MSGKEERVTVDPSAVVVMGDWCHLPAMGPKSPETFVCLSPGATVRRVVYHDGGDGGLSVTYVTYCTGQEGDKYLDLQADALRDHLLRRVPLYPETE